MTSNLCQKIYCCPDCRQDLLAEDKFLNCPVCHKQYPLIKGIPVFQKIDLEKYQMIDLSQAPVDNPFHYALHFWFYKKYLKKYLQPKPEDVILDIGCGVGHCLSFLNQFSKNLIGLEVDLPLLLYAQQILKTDYVLADGAKLPFKDDSFDKIISFVVLEHIQDDQAAVREMRRVGKNRATVLIIVPALEGPRLRSKEKILMHNEDENEGAKHFRDGYSKEGIKKLLKDNGIKAVKIRHTMFLGAELFMEFSRIIYSKKYKTYRRQTDWFKVCSGKLFSLYKILSPLIGGLALLEDWLFSWSKKGHMIVIKGEIDK